MTCQGCHCHTQQVKKAVFVMDAELAMPKIGQGSAGCRIRDIHSADCQCPHHCCMLPKLPRRGALPEHQLLVLYSRSTGCTIQLSSQVQRTAQLHRASCAAAVQGKQLMLRQSTASVNYRVLGCSCTRQTSGTQAVHRVQDCGAQLMHTALAKTLADSSCTMHWPATAAGSSRKRDQSRLVDAAACQPAHLHC